MESKPLVYLAGPLTCGDYTRNCLRAYGEAHRLIGSGFDVFCPHSHNELDDLREIPYERWMELDFNILRRCDAVLRIPGESPGADREVRLAKMWNMPVFFEVEDLISWKEKRQTLENPR